jgi:hypothetical protein
MWFKKAPLRRFIIIISTKLIHDLVFTKDNAVYFALNISDFSLQNSPIDSLTHSPARKAVPIDD